MTLAEAYATEFGRVYLNVGPQTPARREQQFARFVLVSLATAHADLGWNGAGTAELNIELPRISRLTPAAIATL